MNSFSHVRRRLVQCSKVLCALLLLAPMAPAMGCGEGGDNCGARCLGDRASLRVKLEPPIAGGYEVDLVLDGETGAFTCGGIGNSCTGPTNQAGVANAVDDCWGVDFWVDAAPESVQIAVASLDGSWIGSVNESPDYVRVSRCPGGTELCPPFAVVAIKPR